jgi:arylsulfatase A-like enzyme
MTIYFTLFLLLPLAFSTGKMAESLRNDPPNVILIVTDDQGYGDVGVYGSVDLKTPHIDDLMNSGVRFTNWYANAPVCAPTRASIMTGKYPRKAGVPNLLGVREPGMHLEEETIANAFGSMGYRTGLIGKWHLGGAMEYRPNNRGFDYFFGILEGCVDYFSHMYFLPRSNRPFHDLWRNEKFAWEDGKYLTHLITDESLKFICEHKAHPFYLNISYTAPHYPLQVPQNYLDEFHELDAERQAIAALLKAVDDGVGQLLGLLEELSLRENTIIFFQSDNGPSNEKRNFYYDYEKERFEGSSSGDLTGNKGSLYEGGIRVPAAISWRGVIPAGIVNHNIGMSMDLYPTLVSMAGGKTDQFRKRDGKDLTDMIMNAGASPHEAICWEYRDQRAIRMGKWKLIKNPWLDFKREVSDSIVLYNLEEDEREGRNLAGLEPEICKMLLSRLDQWEHETRNPYEFENE